MNDKTDNGSAPPRERLARAAQSSAPVTNPQAAPQGKTEVGRRDFLRGAALGGVAVATVTGAAAPSARAEQAPAVPAAYALLNLDEQAFVEALVDHMVPADDLTPKGTDLGINIYIDRALEGGWGKGDRLYLQGPWKKGVPSQGYQLPLTPAQLIRAGIAATNAHCRKTYGRTFDKLDEASREGVLVGLSKGTIEFDADPSNSGPPVRVFWSTLYQTVMEGMFSDPIHGGNRDKAGWKLIGFPGAIAVHREHIEQYKDKAFPNTPVGIQDMS